MLYEFRKFRCHVWQCVGAGSLYRRLLCPNVKTISMTLGHATIAETLDIYGHLLPGDNQTVTAAVADYLAGL
jgi:hypothetical protein